MRDSEVAVLYEDRERRIPLIVLPFKGVILERTADTWAPTTTKWVTLNAISLNTHGFFRRKRALGTSETLYQEVASYLA